MCFSLAKDETCNATVTIFSRPSGCSTVITQSRKPTTTTTAAAQNAHQMFGTNLKQRTAINVLRSLVICVCVLLVVALPRSDSILKKKLISLFNLCCLLVLQYTVAMFPFWYLEFQFVCTLCDTINHTVCGKLNLF